MNCPRVKKRIASDQAAVADAGGEGRGRGIKFKVASPSLSLVARMTPGSKVEDFRLFNTIVPA